MLKNIFFISVFVFCSVQMMAQETESSREQQIENLTENTDGETEDDSFLQSLDQFRKNKINLNTASINELRELKILSDLQIQNLIRYRNLLGKFISIYEIQAIPTWDIQTIQILLPFIRVGESQSLTEDFGKRLSLGQHSILARVQQNIEESKGYTKPDSVVNKYLGSRQRVFFRYKYVYRNLLQYGIVGDKDGGEQFFKGNNKQGFDFYSFHIFARNIGRVKELALGDFTVNMGQGLIQWQSMAFKKSADVTAIKRQAATLRPYNSAGEINFHRGIGLTVAATKNLDITAFASIRNLDGNFNVDTSQNNEDFLSSIYNTGYHRTPTEISNKNTFQQTTFGAVINYNKNAFHLGLNGIAFKFSTPIVKSVDPYNQYAIQGKEWYNYSIDYSYTYKNLHFFGETAMSKGNAFATVNGLLASIDQRVDASLVYRNISKEYQSLYTNAFTETTYPNNENGLFAGLALRPFAFLTINAYADVFSFPWLRYRVDAPSKGSDYFVQATYKPSKAVELYTRYNNQSKAINLSGLGLPTRFTVNRPRQNWRTQVTYKYNKELTFKSRVELLWFDTREKERAEQGFMMYADATYKPFGKPIALNLRLLYYETDSYDSRIYTFENDVLYSFSIPAFYGKGYRYYLNINYDISKKITTWFRIAQTVYSDQKVIGSGLDEIQGNKKTEVKFQVLYNLF